MRSARTARLPIRKETGQIDWSVPSRPAEIPNRSLITLRSEHDQANEAHSQALSTLNASLDTSSQELSREKEKLSTVESEMVALRAEAYKFGS